MVCLDEGGRGRRAIRLIPARADLQPWVEHFFIQVRICAERRQWRVVPDTSSHVIFSLTNGKPHCRLVGSRSSYCDIDTSHRRVTVGARLRPGALVHLTRCAADGLTDGSFPMEDIFGAAGRELGARLAEDTPREALLRLGRFLMAKLDGCQPDFRLERALRLARSVGAAAEMLNISPRTVRARALQVCGLGPKRILRIRRLHRALACGAEPLAVWSDVASRTGYADQAHMVREFQSLLGDSPESWRRRAAADLFNTPDGAVC
jgi:AraC-like DNA-binding protein